MSETNFGFIDPMAPMATRVRRLEAGLKALEAEVAELRAADRARLPRVPEGLDLIVRKLIEERVRRDMSQREIMRILGCSSATVSSWERGISSPTLNHLRSWAAALGFDLTLTPGAAR